MDPRLRYRAAIDFFQDLERRAKGGETSSRLPVPEEDSEHLLTASIAVATILSFSDAQTQRLEDSCLLGLGQVTAVKGVLSELRMYTDGMRQDFDGDNYQQLALACSAMERLYTADELHMPE